MEEKTTQMVQKKSKIKIRAIIVITFIVLFALISFINYRSEYLQIKEISENYIDVFKTNITYKYAITAINFVVWFIAIYITNKIIKKGLKSFFIAENKEMPKLANKSLALVIGGVISVFTSDLLVNKAMLFINSTWFGGNGDPIFGHDIGYYMFQKPFIEAIILYVLIMVAVLTIYTIAYYIIVFNKYFDGIDSKQLKKGLVVKQIIVYVVIMAICFSALTFLKSQDIVFGEFINLEDADKTSLNGAGFTDVTVNLWGQRLFVIVILAAVVFGIKFLLAEKYKKAAISILCIPGYLVVLFVVSAGFQAMFVSSNILDTEKTYIDYNIQSTKKAYNIDIEEIELENVGTSIENRVTEYENVINNIPVISEEMTLATLNTYQDSVGFYKYDNTKLQNYNDMLVYVTPREIMTDGSNRTYDNKTYNYTHGFGSVITYATKTDETGGVEYLQVDFGGKDAEIDVKEPRIYFGLQTNSTIVVNSKDKTEFDYPITTSTNTENDYNGLAGLNLGFFDRAIIGLTKSNVNLAFIDGDSKIIMNRNIIQRAQKLMPYLIYDDNPYLVITDEGRQVWVLDAYTISENYPYSQKTTLETKDAKTKINYIRNSVKVLIDAYDGTTKFYITDRTDPIIMAYSNMYENLFVEESEAIPQGMLANITYPELLYKVQANMYQRYHKIQTEVLYRNDDLWSVAKFNTSKAGNIVGTTMTPYYTKLKTKYDEEHLGLVIPYTSYGKQNIVSYLVGTFDGASRLKLYKFPQGSNVLGPAQLNQQIEQDETISKEIEALNTSGSKVVKNMIIVPLDDSLLYVEPVYQVLLNEKTQVQHLKKVIVAFGNKVAIGDTIMDAINNILSKQAVNIEVESADDEENLINAIIKANTNLQQSNDNSDWEMMGKDIKRLQDLVSQLEKLRKEKSKNEVVKNTITNSITNDVVNNLINDIDI